VGQTNHHNINNFNYIQGALGKQDLGRLHYKPVKDRNGSTVIVAVNSVIVSMMLVMGWKDMIKV